MENSFLHRLTELDYQLLIFLNNLGSEQWDGFWLFVTKQFNWIPLFLIIFYLIFKKFGTKKAIFVLLFMTLLIAFSDQFTNLIKNTTERLRPCNTPDLQGYLRQFTYKPRGFSFWSGHASLSMTSTVFIILLLRKPFKYIYFFLIFPIIFGYSRIYLGVHFPIDVTSGYISGLILGYLFYNLFRVLYLKIFREELV